MLGFGTVEGMVGDCSLEGVDLAVLFVSSRFARRNSRRSLSKERGSGPGVTLDRAGVALVMVAVICERAVLQRCPSGKK